MSRCRSAKLAHRKPLRSRLIALAWLLVAPVVSWGDLSVEDVIAQVRRKHPVVQFGQKQKSVAESRESLAEASYFPSLELNGVYTSGFPAGIINLGGVPGAAFRSGPAAGAIVKQNMWDFGRTSSARAFARSEATLYERELEVELVSVQETALRAYFDCSRVRDQAKNWKELLDDFQSIQKTISLFVSSGQRSRVEQTLATVQAEEAFTKLQDYQLRYKQARRRLAQVAFFEEDKVTCPLLGEPTRVTDSDPDVEGNPLLVALKEEVNLASKSVDQVTSQHAPRLFGLASYGVMQNRSAAEDTYSVGIGLVVPIFTGFRRDRDEALAQASRDAKEARVSVARNKLQEHLLRFEETIASSALRKGRLRLELAQTEKAFELAKDRYLSMQGRIADLREILRNLASVKSALVDVRSEEHLTRALRANFLGKLK